MAKELKCQHALQKPPLGRSQKAAGQNPPQTRQTAASSHKLSNWKRSPKGKAKRGKEIAQATRGCILLTDCKQRPAGLEEFSGEELSAMPMLTVGKGGQ